MTDGPFAETREQLGGCFVLDVESARRGDRAYRRALERATNPVEPRFLEGRLESLA